MTGAIVIGFFDFKVANKRSVSLTGLDMKLPIANQIGRRPLIGSVLFGIGWASQDFALGRR